MPPLTLEFITSKGCSKNVEFGFEEEGTMIGSEGFSVDGGSFLTGAGLMLIDPPPPLSILATPYGY